MQEQIPIGLAEVRAVFSSGSGRVAGCMVTEGKIVKDCGIRVRRKGQEVHVGVLSSLKRVKEMVKEVISNIFFCQSSHFLFFLLTTSFFSVIEGINGIVKILACVTTICNLFSTKFRS